MDDIYRESFAMYWFGNLSQKEIADILNVSIPTVKMRCMRAMTELIRTFKPYMSEISSNR